MKSLLLGVAIAVTVVSGVWGSYLTAFKITCGQWLDTRMGRPERVELFQQVEELKAYLAGQATALEEVNAELHELEIRVGIPSTRPMGAESAINVDWINADLLCAKSGRNERVGTVMNAYYYKIMEALRGDLAALIKAYQGAK